MRHFQPDELLDLTVRLLKAAGASEEHAQVVGEHLVAANLAGHDSHGLIRIPQYYRDAHEGKLALGASVEILRENSVSALLDGHWTWPSRRPEPRVCPVWRCGAATTSAGWEPIPSPGRS